MMDKLHEECGVFGISGHSEASNMAYLGLHALQHRGQESAGIVSSDGVNLHGEMAMGLVSEIFTQDRLKKLPGLMAVGHNRYSTAGESHIKNTQPILVDYSLGSFALAHNGTLVNAEILRSELEAYGSIFRSTMDSEVIVHLVAQSKEARFSDRIIHALKQVKGAYSIVMMNEKELVAVRDPKGFRPFALGKLNDAYVVASETCAFDLIEAEFVREVEPGELIHIQDGKLQSFFPFKKVEKSFCIFEFIYFARPDSFIFGESVNRVRKDLGRQLARESQVDADVVFAVPDSGVQAALGFSSESGITYDTGLIRSHYRGRTFIEPQQSIRHFGVKLKLNPVRDVINGKRVLVIDDSIVRGTTSRKIVKMIRNAGAKEVHLRISSPPTSYPCYYGIDTPNRSELIGATHSLEEICKYVTADSLQYLSMEGMLNVFQEKQSDYCRACFNGEYPVHFPGMNTTQMDLFAEGLHAKKTNTYTAHE